MASLHEITVGQDIEFKRVLARAGFDGDVVLQIIKTPDLAVAMREAILAKLEEAAKPLSFVLSVEAQLARFKAANEAQGWGFGEEVFAKLAASAPEWPEGKLCVRSLRIRFGEGDTGVAQTFEAHASEIRRVFGAEKYWRWEHLRSAPSPYSGDTKELKRRFGDKPIERLRLLSGNETHKPVVEWVAIDLDTHRQRRSIEAVRDPKKSLADEMLVVTWMFPELIRAIDYDEIPGLFAAGYELNVPERDEVEWQSVPYVYFYCDSGQVGLNADWHGYGRSCDSVPSLRE